MDGLAWSTVTTQAADAAETALAPLELAELLLLSAGVIILTVGGLLLAARRQFGAFLSLPAPGPNHLSLIDIGLTVWLFVFVPPLVSQLVRPAITPEKSETTPAASQQAQAVAGTQPAHDSDETRAADASAEEPPPARTLRQAAPLFASQLVLAPLLIWMGIARFGGARAWGLTLRHAWRDAWLAVVAYAAVWPVCSALLWLSTLVFEALGIPIEEHTAIKTLLSPDTPASVRLLTAASAVVLAPIIEEAAVRGLLLPGLVKLAGSPWIGVVATALVFGIIHAPVAHTVAPLALFGAVLGFAYLKTGSLTLVMLIHAVFNAKTVLWIALVGPLPETQM